MPRHLLLPLTLTLAAGAAGPAAAAGPAQIRVLVEVQEEGRQQRQGVQGGGVLIVEPRTGAPRGRGGLGVEDTTRRTTRSTGLFVIATEGEPATILVAQDIPQPHIAFFYDHARGWGHVVQGTVWQRVGAGLAVRAWTLPERRLRVRLAPWLSYLGGDGGGAVELIQAATELVVPHGQRVALGGATTELHAVTRRILGYRTGTDTASQAVFLTATVQ